MRTWMIVVGTILAAAGAGALWMLAIIEASKASLGG